MCPAQKQLFSKRDIQFQSFIVPAVTPSAMNSELSNVWKMSVLPLH